MTIILAKFFGLYFLAVGFAFLLHPQRISGLYRRIMENEEMLFFAGIIALFLGSFVVSVHNVWILNWPVLLTIVGWLSLVKGVGLLAYPEFTRIFSFILHRPLAFYRGMGGLMILLGAFFFYQGWIVGGEFERNSGSFFQVYFPF